MINARKELPDVAFEDPAGSRIVPAHFVSKLPKPIQSPMRPLPDAAGVGIGDERPVKEGIEDSVDSVVQQPVADARLMDAPGFGVMDGKGLIAAVAVGTMAEVAMQLENAIHQPERELLDIAPVPFAPHKFPPRFQEVLDADYIFVASR